MFILIFLIGVKFEPITLANLNSKWTIGVNITSRYLGSRYIRLETSSLDKYSNAGVLVSNDEGWGFPGEFVILRRIKDFAIGIEARAYGSSPTSDYEYFEYATDTLKIKRVGNIKETYQFGSIGVEIYKYFCTKKSLSSYISLAPFFSQDYGEYSAEYTSYEQRDTVIDTIVGYLHRIYKMNDFGVRFNCGLEYFFKFFDKKLSIAGKTSFITISRNYYEHEGSRQRKYYNNRIEKRIYTGKEKTPYRVDFFMPTKGNFTLWICFHF